MPLLLSIADYASRRVAVAHFGSRRADIALRLRSSCGAFLWNIGCAALLLSLAGCDSSPAATTAEPVVSDASASVGTSSAQPAGDATSASAPETRVEPTPSTAQAGTSDVAVLPDNSAKNSSGSEKPAKAADAKPDRPERIKDLTFDDLKFEMVKEDPFERSMLTPEIEKLDGKPIRIRGYILPTSVFSQKGFTNFVLVRDNQECCFGPGAALYDAIIVRMEPGKTADFNIFPVAVEGTFSIKELKGPGGRHLAIYQMMASSVK